MSGDLKSQTIDDLAIAARHFEDLEIFVGQRSRMHPGPGWALVLDVLRGDLAAIRAELQCRRHGDPAGSSARGA